jgi:hypothetical protein
MSPEPEFWADYQCSLRVAVESQRKNKAIGNQIAREIAALFIALIQFDFVCAIDRTWSPTFCLGPVSVSSLMQFGNGALTN